MEILPFVDVVPIGNGGISIAMLVFQRVCLICMIQFCCQTLPPIIRVPSGITCPWCRSCITSWSCLACIKQDERVEHDGSMGLLGCPRNLGSMVSKWVINVLINGVCGTVTHLLTIYQIPGTIYLDVWLIFWKMCVYKNCQTT